MNKLLQNMLEKNPSNRKNFTELLYEISTTNNMISTQRFEHIGKHTHLIQFTVNKPKAHILERETKT